MEIKKVVDGIAGIFEKKYDHVFKQEIRDLVIIARAEAMRQHMDKHNVIPASFVSQINSLKIKKVSASECSLSEDLCTVYRTELKIPKPIRLKNQPISFTYVGPIDNHYPFGYLPDPSDILFRLKDKFAKRSQYYTYLNEYIYLLNTEDVDKIKIRGPFSDLDTIGKLNNCNGNNCDGLFEIADDILVLVKNFVYNELRGTSIIPLKEEIRLNEEDSSD